MNGFALLSAPVRIRSALVSQMVILFSLQRTFSEEILWYSLAARSTLEVQIRVVDPSALSEQPTLDLLSLQPPLLAILFSARIPAWIECRSPATTRWVAFRRRQEHSADQVSLPMTPKPLNRLP
jgi:hypothetical protein